MAPFVHCTHVHAHDLCVHVLARNYIMLNVYKYLEININCVVGLFPGEPYDCSSSTYTSVCLTNCVHVQSFLVLMARQLNGSAFCMSIKQEYIS